MEIVTKRIKDITPYGKNPRKNDGAVRLVANSIKEFGFKVPIILDSNGVIIAGHTRLKAAEGLGMNEVPCIVADDLSEEQVRAFRLADNKVAEGALWDFPLLDEELSQIFDIDMSNFGFDIETDLEDESGYFGDERERTYNAVNLHDFDAARTEGFYQMPLIRKTDHVPEDLISFNYMLTSKEYEKGIHFFIDDYQFERIWNDPHKYLDKLAQFDCACTPDFSLYLDMPIAMQIWNTYRSRLVGQIMQDAGVVVIPTLSWSTPESYTFCFDGIEPGGTVAVGTVGVKEDETARKIWASGMAEALKRLKPSHVVVYGGDIGYAFKCETTFIDNHNSKF